MSDMDLTERLAVVLGEFGIRAFVMVGSMGDDFVAVAGTGCSHCLIASLAGALRSNAPLRELVSEAMAVAEGEGEAEMVCLH